MLAVHTFLPVMESTWLETISPSPVEDVENLCWWKTQEEKKKFEEKHVSLLSKCWAELIRAFHANQMSSAARIAGFHF